MRYKNNVLDKLTQIESTVTKIQFQVNRGMGQDQILDSVEDLKEQIEKTREMVSLEPDECHKELHCSLEGLDAQHPMNFHTHQFHQSYGEQESCRWCVYLREVARNRLVF